MSTSRQMEQLKYNTLVLVLDDNERVAAVLAEFLRRRGLAAEYVTAVDAAVERLRRDPQIDCLLTDRELDGSFVDEHMPALKMAGRGVTIVVATDVRGLCADDIASLKARGAAAVLQEDSIDLLAEDVLFLLNSSSAEEGKGRQVWIR